MAAIFDLPFTMTSESIHNSPTVLRDSENIGVAVGILLLSHIEAEMMDIAYVLPVTGGHLWFTSHADVGDKSQ